MAEDEPKPEEPKPEEPKPEEPKPTEPTPADGEVSKSQLEIGKEIIEEMKAQNAIMTTNLKKAEKLSSEQLLGGHIPAGKRGMTQDEKDTAAARELLKGTGWDDELFPIK